MPGLDLCTLRPELIGDRGRVESTDGDEVVVEWTGRSRLYRVQATLLEKGT